MCGITGFLDITPHRPKEALEAIVRGMADALTHRGPDEGNVWVKPERGVALGHRRLAIQDISPAGAQPMVSVSGRYVIVYNGELYNVPELKAAIHYTPRGTSDTEILLEHIAAHGVPATLERLNGIFAFALYDLETHTLTLARDQLGVKPLYYGFSTSRSDVHEQGEARSEGGRGGASPHNKNQTFLFGSELKALKKHPQFTATLNMHAAQHMLQHGCVHAPDSIYENIHQLAPGTWGELKNGVFTTHTYYSIADVAARGQANTFTGNLQHATDALHEKLQAAVQSQMISDVPLGAFLSGGIDSSTVVALMQAHSSLPVKTFSIGFAEGAYNESSYAEAVAKHLGTDHVSLMVSAKQAQDVIPLLSTLYDEPFADSSQIPTFLVSQLARQHVTVALSGDGGDECFGGYVRHQALARMWRYLSPVPQPLRAALSNLLQRVPTQVWQSIGHLIPAHKRPAHFAEKLQKAARLLGANSVGDMYGQLVRVWGSQSPLSHNGRGCPNVMRAGEGENINRFNFLPSSGADAPPSPIMGEGKFLSAPAQLRLSDFQTYLPDDILTKVDRASMANSLEARVPLLDKDIVEFACTLPDDVLMQGGIGKRPLRGVLHKYVPEALFDRPKQGFSIPIEHWLRTDLRDWAEDLLSEEALKALPYDVAAIRQRWQQHLAGTHLWHHSLWHVLMLQAWVRQS